jgi:hypothetical protein
MTRDQLAAQLAAIERRLAERVTITHVIVDVGPDGKLYDTGERITRSFFQRQHTEAQLTGGNRS